MYDFDKPEVSHCTAQKLKLFPKLMLIRIDRASSTWSCFEMNLVHILNFPQFLLSLLYEP